MLVSMQIVVYLFLGGASAGMLLSACLWSLRFGHAPTQQSQRKKLAFDTLFARCVAIGAILILISILCLFWDLGRPDRVLALVLTSRPNVLTLGALCLGAEFLITVIIATLLIAKPPVSSMIRPLCEALCAIVSIVVILYTGVYLFSMESVAFWHSLTLLAVFLFSSLSTGISLMLLIAYFTHDQALILNAVKPMQRVHLVFILLETLSIALFLWAAVNNPNAEHSVQLLFGENMFSTATIGIVGMAIAVPFSLESYSLASRAHRNIPASDVICLVGGFALRYVIVACGMH